MKGIRFPYFHQLLGQVFKVIQTNCACLPVGRDYETGIAEFSNLRLTAWLEVLKKMLECFPEKCYFLF